MKFLALLLTLLTFIATPARAEEFDNAAFRAIPILHDGRIKPLDSYARIRLKQFSGTDSHAAAWLAETLFDPATAAQKPIFRVPSSDVRKRLGLDNNQRLFTLAEIQTGLQKPEIISLLQTQPETPTTEQHEILALAENVMIYNQMLRSFSQILPLAIPGQEKPLSYLQLLKQRPGVLDDVKKLIARKGTNPDNYKDSEKELAALAFILQQIQSAGADNTELKVIKVDDTWLSPWGSREWDQLSNWAELAKAYRENNNAAWAEFSKATAAKTGPHKNFTLEILYNKLKPFHIALGLYALAFILFMLPGTWQLWIEFFAITFGLLAHGTGILARVLILERPPVGTLYEAVLFVSFICALMGLRRTNPAAQLSGLSAAILLLTIAPSLLQTGDSMEMLVAVLNTNFWLSTHVLCITAGYALSILTACIAHIDLLARAAKKPPEIQSMLSKNIYAFSLAALLLTAVGTALGGIWADQSWGRFWGWDPKENGALLIVLWLLWLLHGRMAGKLSRVAFAAGMAFLNVIVALAWFGVNLLSVGLHSYGFTSGIAFGLGLFCSIEMLLIGWLWFTIRKAKHAH